MVAQWRPPAKGRFEFDFVALDRPPIAAMPVPRSDFAAMLELLSTSESDRERRREKREDVSDGLDNEGSKDDLDDEASTEEPQPFIAQLTRLPITREEVRNKQAADRRKLRVIREAATEMYFTVDMLRSVLSMLTDAEARVETAVIMFSRMLDGTALLGALQAELTAEELQACFERIGYLNLFTPLEPDGEYRLDLASFEERQVASILIELSTIEVGSISQLGWNGRDLGSVMPHDWFDELPASGIMQITYHTSHADPAARQRLSRLTLINRIFLE